MVWGSGFKNSTPTQRIRDESNPDGEPTFSLAGEATGISFCSLLTSPTAGSCKSQGRSGAVFSFSEKVKLTPGILNEKPINSRYTGKFTFLETKVMQILVQMIVLVQLGWFLFGFLAAILISNGFGGFKDVVLLMCFSSAPWGGRFDAIFEVHIFHHGVGIWRKNNENLHYFQRIFPEELGRLEPWNNKKTWCVSEGIGKLMCWSMIHMNMNGVERGSWNKKC